MIRPILRMGDPRLLQRSQPVAHGSLVNRSRRSRQVLTGMDDYTAGPSLRKGAGGRNQWPRWPAKSGEKPLSI